MDGVAGMRVLVTGAAGGIGACVARRLGEAGARLFLTDINGAGLKRTMDSLASSSISPASSVCDITVPSDVGCVVQIACEAIGNIDALVHCAGRDAPPGLAWEENEAHWREIIDTDLSGAWWFCRALIPSMIAAGAGRIILIGSVAARTESLNASAAYNAAKAGVNGLVIGLSAQVEHHGIRINVVAPGPTGTGARMSDAERAQYRSRFPLGEGGADPVANACLYLLGPGGDWISGTVLNVSGGRIRG